MGGGRVRGTKGAARGAVAVAEASILEAQDRALMLGQVLIKVTLPVVKDGVRLGLEGEFCVWRR
jgi:hypothetical protein